MAEIQKRTETVVKNFYRLDLSEEEAEVLAVVLATVGGSVSGYRGVAKEILEALGSEGASWHTSPVGRKYSGAGITFDDTK